MTRILLLNGPPRSGKDTAGEMAANLLGGHLYKFAHALKIGTHALFYAFHGDLSPTTLAHVLQPSAFEADKDIPQRRFFGLTPRQAYIAVSEVMAKPTFGPRFFGEVLAAHLERAQPAFAIVTDSGFVEETEVLIERWGYQDVAMIQLSRPLCGFEGDSRGYVNIPSIATSKIHNAGTLPMLRFAVQDVLTTLGWLPRT